jgi:hypothetical protein
MCLQKGRFFRRGGGARKQGQVLGLVCGPPHCVFKPTPPALSSSIGLDLRSNTDWLCQKTVPRIATGPRHNRCVIDAIVSPLQRPGFELQERIPGAKMGTVDKFQGQEAPIVIYSMTTSSHSDAPKGMEFQSSECGHVAREVPLRCGSVSALVRSGMSNTPPDAAG